MDIIKIIGIGLISLIIAITVKQYKPEFAIYISIMAGILIFALAFDKLAEIVRLLTNLANKTSVNNKFINLLIKITGIAILTEFAVSLCKDAGESSVGSKVELAGKVVIFYIAMPVLTAILQLIDTLLG